MNAPAAPSVDLEYAKATHAEATRTYRTMQEDPLASSAMVGSHYDNLLQLNTIIKLWDDVIHSGWNQATIRFANIMGGAAQFQGGSFLDMHHHAVAVEAALRWWRANRRRAMKEGFDPEILSMSL